MAFGKWKFLETKRGGCFLSADKIRKGLQSVLVKVELSLQLRVGPETDRPLDLSGAGPWTTYFEL